MLDKPLISTKIKILGNEIGEVCNVRIGCSFSCRWVFIFLSSLWLIVGCERQEQNSEVGKAIPLSAEQTLHRLVTLFFEGKEQEMNQYLLEPNKELTAAEATGAGETKTEFTSAGLVLKTFKVLNESCHQTNECQIKYFVSYSNPEQTLTEVKKVVLMRRENKEKMWKVADITHLKTYHQLMSPLEVTSK